MQFTKSHEWIKEEDGIVIMGITDHAQDQLSDVVYVDLPQTGSQIKAGESFMVIESVKAASDIYAPISGEIVEINESLRDSPGQVNESPEKNGWLVKVKPHPSPGDEVKLLTSEEYQTLIR